MRKQYVQIEFYTGEQCILYLHHINYYTKDVLVHDYIPFIGLLLDNYAERQVPECGQISFLTQKVLLTALYNNWNNITVTSAAQILQVSKMSVTRCFDEIEAMSLPYLKCQGRSRKLSVGHDKKNMWKTIKPHLRSTLIRQFRLAEKISADLPLSGMSALSSYSMLEDNSYQTVAVSKNDLNSYGIRENSMIPVGEEPTCIIQELGYIIRYSDKKAIDPLTTAMLIKEQNKECDPRIEKAVDEMLREYVW
ncbi:MAG: hypothetical protein KBH85_06515 [Lachnospiraceae bacterium]|nr:hypothetical protein [Lachnospiraceae bacterium]